jgi:hypothetical protein
VKACGVTGWTREQRSSQSSSSVATCPATHPPTPQPALLCCPHTQTAAILEAGAKAAAAGQDPLQAKVSAAAAAAASQHLTDDALGALLPSPDDGVACLLLHVAAQHSSARLSAFAGRYGPEPAKVRGLGGDLCLGAREEVGGHVVVLLVAAFLEGAWVEGRGGGVHWSVQQFGRAINNGLQGGGGSRRGDAMLEHVHVAWTEDFGIDAGAS